MEDISLHILDILQNSIAAGAGNIEIEITGSRSSGMLTVTIRDDGKGMDEKTLKSITDPFFSTKDKRVGLGIPLLAQSANEAGGQLNVESGKGEGTVVKATFMLNHIDRKPLGDITSTLLALIAGHPEVDLRFSFNSDDKGFVFDTGEVKRELGDVPISYPAVLSLLRRRISEGIGNIRSNRHEGGF